MRTFLVLALLLPCAAAAEPPSYRVIAHAENPRSELTTRELADLFLRKTARWDHGPVVEPVDLPAGSPARDAFSNDVLGRSPERIESFWRQKMFAGESVAPEKKAGDDEVIAFVAGHAGAIGYVAATASLGEAVKALDVVSEPRPVYREPPRYPEMARRHELEGVVLLRVTVDAKGQVTHVEVKEGHVGLNQEAIRVLKLWKFEPATRNGEPIEWQTEIPVRFALE